MLSWNYCPSKLDRVGLGSKKKIKIFVERLPSARRQGKELVFFSTLLISWIFQILKDDVVKVLHSSFQQIWKTQQWPQDWKKSVFIPIPKKGNAKGCSNYCTIALISHISNAQNSPSQSSTGCEPRTNFQMYKLDLEKAEEPEIKLPTSVGS